MPLSLGLHFLKQTVTVRKVFLRNANKFQEIFERIARLCDSECHSETLDGCQGATHDSGGTNLLCTITGAKQVTMKRQPQFILIPLDPISNNPINPPLIDRFGGCWVHDMFIERARCARRHEN